MDEQIEAIDQALPLLKVQKVQKTLWKDFEQFKVRTWNLLEIKTHFHRGGNYTVQF